MSIKNKVALSFILLMLVVASIILPCFGATGIAFDDENVLTDLLSSPDFDINKYDYDENSNAQIIKFVEYCYSPFVRERANYGLYVYLFNPTNAVINTSAEQYIQIAPGEPKKNNYNKYRLKLLSSSSGTFENLFHKFKVIGLDDNFISKLNSVERIYNVSGIELTLKSGRIDNTVGGTYYYTGYAKGYGIDKTAESTLRTRGEPLETVEININHTAYLGGTSSQSGADIQQQVSTAYFSIPNRLFEDYGTLDGITAEWYEYKTKPIYITSNQSYFNGLSPYIGVDVTTTNHPYYMYYGKRGMSAPYTYDWGYGISNANYVANRENFIYYLFKTNSITNDTVVSATELNKYIDNYNKTFTSGKLPITTSTGKEISNDLFEANVDAGRTRGHNKKEFFATDIENLLVYEDSTVWNAFFNYIFGSKPENISFAPIVIANDTDFSGEKNTVARSLLINPNDVDKIKNYQASEKLQGRQTVLFRFAVTDFLHRLITIGKSNIFDSENAIMSQQTIFKQFDIIQFRFVKNDKNTIIPVVSTPIDIAADIPGADDIIDGKKGLPDWVKWLLFFLSIPLIIWLIIKLPQLCGALWDIVSFPFRLIAKVFRAIGGKESNSSKVGKQYKGNYDEKQQAKRRLKK